MIIYLKAKLILWKANIEILHQLRKAFPLRSDLFSIHADKKTAVNTNTCAYERPMFSAWVVTDMAHSLVLLAPGGIPVWE